MRAEATADVIEDADLLRWRMHAQFAGAAHGVAEIARRSAGLQAQDGPAVGPALRARGLRGPEKLRQAYEAGEVVSTWLMRNTLHLVPAQDAGWLLGLFGERNLSAGERRRRELGLTARVCAEALAALPALLDEPRSRADLIAGLRARGVAVEPSGQAPAHLMAYAAAHGVLCRGGEVSPREPGYRPLPAGGRELDGAQALAELARRYAAAFGPAAPADFAAWSGLTRAAARRGFEAAGLTEAAPGLYAAPGAAPPPPGPPLVRLLGPYDTYLLGYRSRDLMLDPSRAARINAGGGVIRPALVVDGRVLGTWRREGVQVLVEPFGRLPSSLRPAVEEEVADVGRFLGVRN
ncbi:winged helix DNA-binding domain-containing protein [Kitasatospora sp. NPDC050543]|uniref:winged helix DNA-binding domain-containing protein n=1 Tax=Kitasatospora sp. NPDC050543 TaxID=3364054 RepID=UPI0037A89140